MEVLHLARGQRLRLTRGPYHVGDYKTLEALQLVLEHNGITLADIEIRERPSSAA